MQLPAARAQELIDAFVAEKMGGARPLDLP
jgi:hypothetical protein